LFAPALPGDLESRTMPDRLTAASEAHV